MKAFWVVALVIFSGAFLSACNSTSTGSPSSSDKGVPLGNTGVHVNGYVDSGGSGAIR